MLKIREMNIKITLRYIPNRMAKIKRLITLYANKHFKQLECHSLLVGFIVSFTLESCLAVYYKVKYTPTPWPKIPLLGAYPREMKAYIHKVLHKNIHRRLIQNNLGNSLAVQRLGLRPSPAGGTSSVPGWGTKILHMAKLKQNKKPKIT